MIFPLNVREKYNSENLRGLINTSDLQLPVLLGIEELGILSAGQAGKHLRFFQIEFPCAADFLGDNKIKALPRNRDRAFFVPVILWDFQLVNLLKLSQLLRNIRESAGNEKYEKAYKKANELKFFTCWSDQVCPQNCVIIHDVKSHKPYY